MTNQNMERRSTTTNFSEEDFLFCSLTNSSLNKKMKTLIFCFLTCLLVVQCRRLHHKHKTLGSGSGMSARRSNSNEGVSTGSSGDFTYGELLQENSASNQLDLDACTGDENVAGMSRPEMLTYYKETFGDGTTRGT